VTFIVLAVFLLDQATKFWIASTFRVGQSQPIIAEIVHLTYVRNTGGAFGLFKGWVPLLILISLVAIVLIVRIAFMQRTVSPRRRLGRFAVSLILGGALGNLADRLHLGYVVDFLDFRVWPVFNVADIAITCGVGFLILELLIPPRRREEVIERQPNPPPST